jgi:hypothetical protein
MNFSSCVFIHALYDEGPAVNLSAKGRVQRREGDLKLAPIIPERLYTPTLETIQKQASQPFLFRE